MPKRCQFYYRRTQRQIQEGIHYLEKEDTSKFLIVAIVVLEDIEKALKKKEYLTLEALQKKLLPKVRDLALLFNYQEAEKLVLFRGDSIDYKVELQENPNRSLLLLPQGPLYSMSKEELLVLQKSLNDLLTNRYI